MNYIKEEKMRLAFSIKGPWKVVAEFYS